MLKVAETSFKNSAMLLIQTVCVNWHYCSNYLIEYGIITSCGIYYYSCASAFL